MPILDGIQDLYRDKGVLVIGASADEPDRADKVAQFAADQEIGLTLWMGATTADMQAMELGDTLPATAILDRDGEVAFRVMGPVTEDILQKRLDWLLSDRSEAAPGALLDTREPEPRHDHHEHEKKGKEGASLVPS
jgi:hypothetical protein